jgi:MATE family multidrug resistance protein
MPASALDPSLASRASGRELLHLAWPIFVAQIAVMGLSVIDTVMAGRLSANDLAAVALGGSIYASVFVGFMGVLQALTPIAGHHYGAGRYADIGTDVGQALWLALFLSLIGVPLLVFNAPWLALTGTEPAVARIAALYLWAVALGLPASLAARAYIALNAAVSRPKVTMAINLAALGAKVPLNFAFMYGAGPLPALGGAGCGVATAVLLWGVLAANWLVYRFDPFYARFHPRERPFVRLRTQPFVRLRTQRWRGPIWARQRELLKLGLPSGGTILIEVTSFTFIALLVARLGAVTVAGHQIVANLVAVLFMMPLAYGIAASVQVAQALGAGSPAAARHAARRGWRVAMATALVVCIAVYLLREPIVAAFTRDAQVAAVALSLLAAGVVFHFFDAMQGVAGFILRGYKVALAPMLIHSVALWGLGLAGGYWLAYHPPAGWTYGGAFSFWAAAAAGLVLAGFAMTWLAAYVARRRERA